MELVSIKTTEMLKPAFTTQTVSHTTDAKRGSANGSKQTATTDVIDKTDNKQPKYEEVQQKVDAMNQMFSEIDTKLQFKVHQDTNQLMVQVVDDANTVIKEFPSHEYLDMVAAIRDYIGILIDKKA